MNDALFTIVVAWMCRLSALAAAVNALELLVRRDDFAEHGTWRASLLHTKWGVWRAVLSARAFTVVLLSQLMLAGILAAWPSTAAGCIAAGLLAFTGWLSSLRFRGNVNGGSDAMLFTVLGGVSMAQLPNASLLVHEAGVLYVAAQLTLSYVRAGLVKITHREWWTGDALGVFLTLPAYGVPSWAAQQGAQRPALLRVASVGVMTFECLAPLAWLSPTASVVFIAAALAFHASTAALFGLNRFLLAWGAALPSLWYASNRL